MERDEEADLTSRAEEESGRGSKQEEEEVRGGLSCLGRVCVFQGPGEENA